MPDNASKRALKMILTLHAGLGSLAYDTFVNFILETVITLGMCMLTT
jgi:hypothetical protein